MEPRFSKISVKVALPILFFIIIEMVMISPAISGNAVQDLINYSYFSELGIGGYDTENQEVRAIQVPFAYQLRPIKGDKWGIRLLFPVTFGVLGLDAVDNIGDVISFDVSALTVVPGVELQIPFRKNWVLKPFGRVGGGWSEEGNAFIYSAGLRSSYTIPWKKFTFTLGNEISFDGFLASGEEWEDYASIAIGWDTRYPLWFTLKGAETYIGGWVSYYYFFDELEFERPLLAPLAIGNQFEIALSFGTYKKIPIWLFKFDRIGLAYRFSENLKAIRIVFEFPF